MRAFADRKGPFADRSRKSSPARLKGNQGNTNDSRSDKRAPHSQLFKPGDAVRESGIYEVVHDAAHRSAHEVVMIANDHFPACDTCIDQVRFRLIRTAPYIFSDEDFEEENK
jgi:hypothetical protein